MRSAALGVAGLLALASSAQDFEPRVEELDPRIVELDPRILPLGPRIEELVVESEAGTDVPIGADVLFAFDSAELSPEAAGRLDAVVAEIQARQPGTVVVEGHTDSIGDEPYNQALSEQRAAAVVAHLGGAAPGPTYEAVGFGETQPVAPNEAPDGTDNPPGRAQNRRVVVQLR